MLKACQLAIGSLFVAAAFAQVNGQDQSSKADPPAPAPAPASHSTGTAQADSFWNGKLIDYLKEGDLLYNARLRYEFAEADPLDASNALTLRNRLGYQTARIHGVQGLLEFEDVRFIGNEDNANLAGTNGEPGRTVVADPEDTEINRAWIGYSNWDSSLKLGRQRVILDNARFVGNVGWRQNEQTYDAVSVANQSLPDTEFFYSYIHNVNRVFGDDHPAGDFDSDSHLAHIAYSGLPCGTLTGYGYFLDLENSPANSSSTIGLSFDGSYPVYREFKATYRAEYAFQTDAAEHPTDYEAQYYHFQAGGAYKKCDAGIGYEGLGDDNGVGFGTPLATLHAHNGWADVFLATPSDGLKDHYAWAGYRLPANIPVRFYYHKFRSNTGGADYGQEFDAVASRQFGEHWKVLAKYAYYDAKDAPFADVQKAWMQVEFNF
jgi:hypothetical protein